MSVVWPSIAAEVKIGLQVTMIASETLFGERLRHECPGYKKDQSHPQRHSKRFSQYSR